MRPCCCHISFLILGILFAIGPLESRPLLPLPSSQEFLWQPNEYGGQIVQLVSPGAIVDDRGVSYYRDDLEEEEPEEEDDDEEGDKDDHDDEEDEEQDDETPAPAKEKDMTEDKYYENKAYDYEDSPWQKILFSLPILNVDRRRSGGHWRQFRRANEEEDADVEDVADSRARILSSGHGHGHGPSLNTLFGWHGSWTSTPKHYSHNNHRDVHHHGIYPKHAITYHHGFYTSLY